MGETYKQSEEKVQKFIANKKTQMAVYAMMNNVSVILRHSTRQEIETKLCGISIQAGYKSMGGGWYRIFVGFAYEDDHRRWRDSNYAVGTVRQQLSLFNCPFFDGAQATEGHNFMPSEWLTTKYEEMKKEKAKKTRKEQIEEVKTTTKRRLERSICDYVNCNPLIKNLPYSKAEKIAWDQVTMRYFDRMGFNLYEASIKHSMSRDDVVVKLNRSVGIILLLEKMIKELKSEQKVVV